MQAVVSDIISVLLMKHRIDLKRKETYVILLYCEYYFLNFCAHSYVLYWKNVMKGGEEIPMIPAQILAFYGIKDGVYSFIH